MVVSHREGSISSNIRAIIEQLNLNPVERRRLIDRTKQDGGARCKSYQGVQPAAKISIGVYGCKEKVEYEIPAPIRRVCRYEERPWPKQETTRDGQRKIVGLVRKEAATLEDDAQVNDLKEETTRKFVRGSMERIMSASNSKILCHRCVIVIL